MALSKYTWQMLPYYGLSPSYQYAVDFIACHCKNNNRIFRLSELHQCDQEMLLGRFS